MVNLAVGCFSCPKLCFYGDVVFSFLSSESLQTLRNKPQFENGSVALLVVYGSFV